MIDIDSNLYVEGVKNFIIKKTQNLKSLLKFSELSGVYGPTFSKKKIKTFLKIFFSKFIDKKISILFDKIQFFLNFFYLRKKNDFFK